MVLEEIQMSSGTLLEVMRFVQFAAFRAEVFTATFYLNPQV
jgi:hypothetical protein